MQSMNQFHHQLIYHFLLWQVPQGLLRHLIRSELFPTDQYHL